MKLNFHTLDVPRTQLEEDSCGKLGEKALGVKSGGPASGLVVSVSGLAQGFELNRTQFPPL